MAEKMVEWFDELDDFLQKKIYPSSCNGNPGRKKNFRRAAAKFHLREGILHRMVKRGNQESSLRVIRDGKEQEEIVSGAHAGFGDSVESKALGGHLGFDKTEDKIASRVWWPSIRKDVRSYIKACDRCQRRAPRLQKGSEQLHPVEIPPHPWFQIGVDICSLPTSKEGYTCMVVAIDYFSKWTEAEPLHRKTAEAVANFLYNCICRHGCFDIQINDRGREFVNSISTELHRLTGVKQKVTSPYHPQANGLVERSNRTIQDMMMKLFSDSSLVDDWPKALPGILFALRTSKHASTKFSPFVLLYGREPKLPVELIGQQDQTSKTQANTECAYSEQQYPSDKTQTETECASSEQQYPSDKTQTETECASSEQQYPSDKTQTETECAYSEQQYSDKTQAETECASSEQQYPSDKTHPETECAYSEQQYPSDKTQTETECAYSEQQYSDKTQTETECAYSEQQYSDKTKTETECAYSEQQYSDKTQTETECAYSEQQYSDKTKTETECAYSEQQYSDKTKTETECASSEQQYSDTKQAETKRAYSESEQLPPPNEHAENPESGKRRLEFSYSDIRQRVVQMETLRKKTTKEAMRNIQNAQERQKKQYCKRRAGSKFHAGDTVLMFNLRRADRKGGKAADVWLGPYEIVRQLPNGTYELANNGVLLKNKASGSNLKPYLKRQCSLLSTPTSPLPAPTRTTSNYSSPATQRTCNSSKSPDNDITVTGETLPPEAVFNPTYINWRKLQCTRFGLQAPKEIPDRQSTEYLGPPEATNPILGDGNCFFRAMSLEITGSQEYHEELRAFTVSFMREKHEAFTGYIGMDIDTYLNTSGMERVRTWGTDVEIMCLATMLQTVIYVYTVTGGSRRWIPYKPYFTSSSIDSNVMSQAVYLSNMCAHYERVIRVKRPHCQKSGLGSN